MRHGERKRRQTMKCLEATIRTVRSPRWLSGGEKTDVMCSKRIVSGTSLVVQWLRKGARKRRRRVWLRISFSCFTGPLLGRNTLQNAGEAESEDRGKRERGQRGSELVSPLRCSEFLAPIASPQYLPGFLLIQATQVL